MTTTVASTRFGALGTVVHVLTTDAALLDVAAAVVRTEIAACDLACSRFRDDSDISRLNAGSGRYVKVSARLIDDLRVAVEAARLTGGLVDPTVGRALVSLGYDRDFSLLERPTGTGELPDPVVFTFAPVPGWQAVDFDVDRVRLPSGVTVDLGATAKARCADRAAAAAARAAGCGVLVNLGGDLAVAGAPPADGWQVRVTRDASDTLDAPGQTVAVHGGAMATSSVKVRAWRHRGADMHHLVDPRSGRPATVVWETVSVVAATCVAANIASTASIILGDDAPAWLAGHGLCARLVATDGSVTTVGGWPPEAVGPPENERTALHSMVNR
jgi:thiamine biosynthesis lipoprotein